jgi:hypothetical protein
LERLERMAATSKAERDPVYDQFRIDPVVARAIRDDKERDYQLGEKSLKTQLSVAEQEERVILRNRIEAAAVTIAVPAEYDKAQLFRDYDRQSDFRDKRLLPPPDNVLSAAEDAEHAQVVARLGAYDQSPTGRGRARIEQLREISGTRRLIRSENEELRQLWRQYSPLPVHPDESMKAQLWAWEGSAMEDLEHLPIRLTIS